MTVSDTVLAVMKFLMLSGCGLVAFFFVVSVTREAIATQSATMTLRFALRHLDRAAFVLFTAYYFEALIVRNTSTQLSGWQFVFTVGMIVASWGHVIKAVFASTGARCLVARLVTEAQAWKGSRFNLPARTNRVYEVDGFTLDLSVATNAIAGTVFHDGQPVHAEARLEVEADGQRILVPLDVQFTT